MLVDRLAGLFGSLVGVTVAVWGLAFKPNTDDVREAPALAIIDALAEHGADVVAFDPIAMDQARIHLGDRCRYAPDAYSALDGADALVLVTEWPEFRLVDVDEVSKRMRGRVVLDGRNALDADQFAAAGFEYSGIGTAPGTQA